MKRIGVVLVVLSGCFAFYNCVPSSFGDSGNYCEKELGVNSTIAEVKALAKEELYRIKEDLIIEGYVISSDKTGNFFGTVHLQDKNGENGIQLHLDSYDLYLFYDSGTKVFVKLKGLYIENKDGIVKLGGKYQSPFGGDSVGRLPKNEFQTHLFAACDEISEIIPKVFSVLSLSDKELNTLVLIPGVEFLNEDLGKTFAEPEESTIRELVDCEGNTLELLTSGYADFSTAILPSTNGEVTGVLQKKNSNYQLVVRDTIDLDFGAEKCIIIPKEETSTSVFFSELADPDNNSGARFVELYNAGDTDVSLEGWKIVRYTNANTEVSSTIELSGIVIQAKSTLVIASNAEEFEKIYGFSPDLIGTASGPAGSNGDDNLQLIDPFETLIDVFGIVGEDGSGTNHEFEDGRAIRKSSVTQASAEYVFSQWLVYNDSGENETINLPQNAPDDYTPGEH